MENVVVVAMENVVVVAMENVVVVAVENVVVVARKCGVVFMKGVVMDVTRAAAVVGESLIVTTAASVREQKGVHGRVRLWDEPVGFGGFLEHLSVAVFLKSKLLAGGKRRRVRWLAFVGAVAGCMRGW